MRTKEPVLRILHAATFTVLLVCTLIPCVGVVRALVDASASGKTFSKVQIEQASTEGFTLRDQYIEYLSRVWYRVFGVVASGKLLPGRDGWFFRGRGKERVQGSIVRRFDNLADLAGLAPFRERSLTHWGKILEKRRAFVENLGGGYHFMVAPRKSVLYAEKLPPPLPLSYGPPRADQLYQYMASRAPHVMIDLTAGLMKEKKREPETLLYLKTDGHWNIVGAFSAYQSIVDHVNAKGGRQMGDPLSRDDFTLRWRPGWSHKGFARLMGFPITESYPTLVQKSTLPLRRLCLAKEKSDLEALRAAQVCDGSKIRLGKAGYPKTTWNGKGAEELGTIGFVKNVGTTSIKRLVIVGDSFGAKLIPMLATHAAETYYVRNVLGFPYDMIEELRPELVIQEVAQGYLFSGLPEE